MAGSIQDVRLSLPVRGGFEVNEMKKLEIDKAVERGEMLAPWDLEWKQQIDRVRGMLRHGGRRR